MGDQDLRGPTNGISNIEILNESGTGYVRFWIDWSVLQPDGGFTFDDIRANPLTASLNEQIKTARNNGLKVILTVNHRYPLWATATPLSTCACAEGDSQCKDKCAEALQKVPTRLDIGSPWAQFIEFLVGEYGRTQDRMNQNHPEYNRYVDYLEIVNEPNLTHRTSAKRTRGGRLVIAMKVADMFSTAQRILLGKTDVTLNLAGPATSDTLKNNKKLTSYREFTRELLAELDRNNFRAGKNFAWSHHNYLDLEEQRNCLPDDENCARARIRVNGQTKTVTPCNPYRDTRGRQKLLSRVNSATWVEETLENGVDGYKWSGMRFRGTDGFSHPAIMLTEGGVRLDKVFEIYWCRIDGITQPVKEPYLCRCPSNFGGPVPCFNAPAPSPAGACTVEDNPEYVAFKQSVIANIGTIKRWQAELVKESFNLMSRGASSKGIALFTNYLTYTDPKYDTGIFDFAESCEQYVERADRTFGDICTGQDGGERPLFGVWKSLRTP
jgi:hypothetical protein